MFKYLLISPLLALNITTSASFMPTQGRNIEYIGPVNQTMAAATAAVMTWAIQDNTQPIDLIMTSNGGEIYWGNQLIAAIEFAKGRNIDVRCLNLGAAQSMAFMIMMHCTHRFAVPGAIWMFHYPRINTQDATTSELKKEALSLEQEEEDFVRSLSANLKMTPSEIRSHCEDETVWTTDALNVAVPKFIQEINGIDGIRIPKM